MGNSIQHSQKELVLHFKQNNPDVLKKIYISTFHKVKVHILKNNGNEAQAKDVFQEAFIACWKNIKEDKFTENGNIEAYLYTIAKNKWTDFLRSSTYKKTVFRDNLVQLIPVDDGVDNEAQKERKQLAIQKALQQMGSECKKLLELFYFERRSMNDISKQLNMQSTSVRNKKYRCMERLKKLAKEINHDG